MGGTLKRESTYIYIHTHTHLWLTHVGVWQRQHNINTVRRFSLSLKKKYTALVLFLPFRTAERPSSTHSALYLLYILHFQY